MGPDTRPVPSPGELEEPWLVFPVSGEVVPTGPARELLVTCAVEVACLPPLRPGGGGTGRSTWPRRGTPCALPSPPPVSPPLSWLRVMSSTASARSPSSFQTRSKPSRRPRRLSCSSGATRPGLMWLKCTPPSQERGHQEGAEGPQQEGEACGGEDQPPEEHPHHAPAEPLRCRAEEEC